MKAVSVVSFMARFLVLVSALGFMASCNPNRPFDPSGGTGLVLVKPSDTEAAITTYNDNHYVFFNDAVASRGVLVVHLPGTGSSPIAHQWIGKVASGLGFHVLGLMYPNTPAVGQLAANNSDLSAFEKIRMEIIEGRDLSSQVEVSAANSITNRLSKLLVYLSAKYPSQGWEQYLDASKLPVWNKIIFSGHSQGGGHAAMIGKVYAVKRVLMFAAPKDYALTISAPAIWYTNGTFQTAKSNFYGFNHTGDDLPRQKEVWEAMKIPGAEVDTFSTPPPYSGSRRLLTSCASPVNLAHASVVQDNETPVVGGVPVFEPVWKYMLTND